MEEEDQKSTTHQQLITNDLSQAEDPGERVAWVHPENFDGWEFLISHHSRRLWTIYHETFTLCACFMCGQEWKYRGGTHYMLKPGVMMMEPGELHRTLAIPAVGNIKFKVAMIPPRQVEEAARELGVVGACHLRGAQTHDPELARLIFRLGHIAEGEMSTLLEIQSLQISIIHRMFGHFERALVGELKRIKSNSLARVKDYLRENIQSSVSLGELSAIAGLSRYWLLRLFSRRYGLPPHRFHIQMRVEQARTLLRQGMTGTEAAAHLGFTDQAHFIRHFKRIMHVTPSEYARGIFVSN